MQALGVKLGSLEVKHETLRGRWEQHFGALVTMFWARRSKLRALESKFVAETAKL